MSSLKLAILCCRLGSFIFIVNKRIVEVENIICNAQKLLINNVITGFSQHIEIIDIDKNKILFAMISIDIDLNMDHRITTQYSS